MTFIPDEVILDTNAILALAKGGVLHLLPQLGPRVVYPPEVDPEVQDLISRRAFEEAKATWLQAHQPSLEALADLPGNLARDPADQAVLALAVERPQAVVITGDRQMIAFLRNRGRRTLLAEDLVVVLKHARLISEGKPILARMMALGYFIPPDRMHELIARMGED